MGTERRCQRQRHGLPDPQAGLERAANSFAAGSRNIYSPYPVIIDLPAGALKQGANQISFNTVGSSVHNIHAELDFSAAAEPAYTPPALVIGGALAPAIPAVGPNAFISQIGPIKLITIWKTSATRPHSTLP